MPNPTANGARQPETSLSTLVIAIQEGGELLTFTIFLPVLVQYASRSVEKNNPQVSTSAADVSPARLHALDEYNYPHRRVENIEQQGGPSSQRVTGVFFIVP